MVFLILLIFFPRWRPSSWVPEMHHEAKCTASKDSIPWSRFLPSSLFHSGPWLICLRNPTVTLSSFCFLLSGLSVDCQSLLSVVLLLGMVMRVGMLWTRREEEVSEKRPSLWSGPTRSPFPQWIIISWERVSYYANGVFVLLPDLNDIIQGLALSSWKLELEQEGRILSTTFETWILS